MSWAQEVELGVGAPQILGRDSSVPLGGRCAASRQWTDRADPVKPRVVGGNHGSRALENRPEFYRPVADGQTALTQLSRRVGQERAGAIATGARSGARRPAADADGPGGGEHLAPAGVENGAGRRRGRRRRAARGGPGGQGLKRRDADQRDPAGLGQRARGGDPDAQAGEGARARSRRRADRSSLPAPAGLRPGPRRSAPSAAMVCRGRAPGLGIVTELDLGAAVRRRAGQPSWPASRCRRPGSSLDAHPPPVAPGVLEAHTSGDPGEAAEQRPRRPRATRRRRSCPARR